MNQKNKTNRKIKIHRLLNNKVIFLDNEIKVGKGSGENLRCAQISEVKMPKRSRLATGEFDPNKPTPGQENQKREG